MKKVLKRLSVVAVSALMVGSAAATLAACGETSDETITVFIFAGTDDQETNQSMVEAWAEEYSKKLVAEGIKEEGYQLKTKCNFQSVTADYFSALIKSINAGTAQDVFYVSPKYVKAWAKKGVVLDLSKYYSPADMGGDPTGIYSQALGLYSYDGTNIGDPVTYDSSTGKFINTRTTDETSIYAFPKDYSTFGLGYNAVFFTDALKTAYKTTKANAGDTVDGTKSIISVAATGEAANIINIGVPTTYYPYNFYNYKSYEEALANDDPVAQFSQLNGGYTVTIPGFPGETYERDGDDSAAWDDDIGYITYTYAEYSAVTWALTYYWNMIDTTKSEIVYGNDQYEGTLYLLPWLAGNNADYINGSTGTGSDGKSYEAYTSVQSGTYQSASGKTINYGIDNEEFIETYAAFAAYGSDWNGNYYYVGNGLNTSGGYAEFKAGNVLFYGVGTWDAAGFNGCSEDTLIYRLMPEPVSEDYALYSRVKDAKYESVVYTDGKMTSSKTDSGVRASYEESEIIKNQEERQDKWAGRVDSVGYGVNTQTLESGASWKAEACVDLVVNMTIIADSQKELTYSGSQLPNYSSMVVDYVGVGSSDKTPTGTFEGAITPDDPQWAEYYKAQNDLYTTNSRDVTVAEYMKENYPNLTYNPDYANKTLKQISSSIRAYLALNMLALDYNSRNICLRMVEGKNGVADSATYTYNDSWLTTFAAQKAVNLYAYKGQVTGKLSYVTTAGEVTETNVCTPYAYCMHYVSSVQTDLNASIQSEKEAIGS